MSDNNTTPAMVRRSVGTSRFDHVSIPVQPDTMEAAVLFFVELLGYTEITRRRQEGEWGIARFFSNGPHLVQLTEERGTPPISSPLPGVHVAFAVRNAGQATQALLEYLQFAGHVVEREAANPEETKWFLTVPDVFGVTFEFVDLSAS